MNLEIFSTLWNLLFPTNDLSDSLSGVLNNPQPPSSSPTPASIETETASTEQFEVYNVLNDQLLAFIMSGEGDSEEADLVRDKMDNLWYGMSMAQQDAVRKHNEKVLGDK